LAVVFPCFPLAFAHRWPQWQAVITPATPSGSRAEAAFFCMQNPSGFAGMCAAQYGAPSLRVQSTCAEFEYLCAAGAARQREARRPVPLARPPACQTPDRKAQEADLAGKRRRPGTPPTGTITSKATDDVYLEEHEHLQCHRNPPGRNLLRRLRAMTINLYRSNTVPLHALLHDSKQESLASFIAHVLYCS
jgi:hypothetical protein